MAVGDGGVDEAVEQLINTASALGSTTIDLSNKRLTQFPAEVLNLHQLEVFLISFETKFFARLDIGFHSFLNSLYWPFRVDSLTPLNGIESNDSVCLCCWYELLIRDFFSPLSPVLVFRGKCNQLLARRVVWLPAILEMARFEEQPDNGYSSHNWKTQVW